jgi:hypothetical protein
MCNPLAVILRGCWPVPELNGVAECFCRVPTVALATVVYRHWLECAAVTMKSTGCVRLAPVNGVQSGTHGDRLLLLRSSLSVVLA